MYTLYFNPGSASMVVHQTLIEMGLPHTLRALDFAAKEQHTPAYLKLNPGGHVPTLVCPDGSVLIEAAGVLINLAERHPDAALAPLPGDPDRAKWIEWITFMSNSLGSANRLWFYPAELGYETYPDDVKAILAARITKLWDRIDAYLAANGPYLLGARFTTADLMLTMYMRWSRNMPRPATQWPALARLAALVKARPSWATLYEHEGLTEWR